MRRLLFGLAVRYVRWQILHNDLGEADKRLLLCYLQHIARLVRQSKPKPVRLERLIFND